MALNFDNTDNNIGGKNDVGGKIEEWNISSITRGYVRRIIKGQNRL